MNNRMLVVCATRETQENFSTRTALGRSLRLYSGLYELRLFPGNSTALPVLYNSVIRDCLRQPATLVFVHDDVHLLDFYWPIRIVQGLAKFDILGLAGNRRRLPAQPAWRFVDDKFTPDARENLSGFVAHGKNWPAEQLSAYGAPGHEVKLLDGVLIAARSETLLQRDVLFDEIFDFHFYDLDFCRTAEERGLRMGTWGISMMHESMGEFGTPSWRKGYDRYLTKWKS
jgi:hypothetical protein